MRALGPGCCWLLLRPLFPSEHLSPGSWGLGWGTTWWRSESPPDPSTAMVGMTAARMPVDSRSGVALALFRPRLGWHWPPDARTHSPTCLPQTAIEPMCCLPVQQRWLKNSRSHNLRPVDSFPVASTDGSSWQLKHSKMFLLKWTAGHLLT